MHMNRELDIRIWRDMNMVSVVRRFVEEVYEEEINDLDTVSRIALSAHELLENAIKYSSSGSVRIRVVTSRVDDCDQVAIHVTNQADPAHLAALQIALSEMADATDPFAHYQALLRISSKRRDGSGLGLARVKAEGEMSLSLRIEGENQICICAQAIIPRSEIQRRAS
jgi:hypothetical protein